MIETTENIYLAEQEANQEEALDSCMDMIHRISHRCKGGVVAFEDLVAVASLAVLESLKSYDPSKGCSFQSYAMFRIRKAIFSHMDSFSRPFSVSWRETGRSSQANNFEFLASEYLDDIESEESFQSDFQRDDDMAFLRTCIEKLGAKEQFVLKIRYGLNGEESLSCAELAKKIGISGEGVRKMETRTIERLRAELLPEYI